MKPICVGCRCFYRPVRTGTYFVEGMPNGSASAEEEIRGLRRPDAWQPYKLWVGDMWRCPDCGHETIAGVPGRPIAQHWMDHFTEAVEEAGAEIQINDC
jgi:hypothetical protein